MYVCVYIVLYMVEALLIHFYIKGGFTQVLNFILVLTDYYLWQDKCPHLVR